MYWRWSPPGTESAHNVNFNTCAPPKYIILGHRYLRGALVVVVVVISHWFSFLWLYMNMSMFWVFRMQALISSWILYLSIYKTINVSSETMSRIWLMPIKALTTLACNYQICLSSSSDQTRLSLAHILLIMDEEYLVFCVSIGIFEMLIRFYLFCEMLNILLVAGEKYLI